MSQWLESNRSHRVIEQETLEGGDSLFNAFMVSGNPTTLILPSDPQPACISISTSKASTPTTAAE
jgi:hypothetical protein